MGLANSKYPYSTGIVGKQALIEPASSANSFIAKEFLLPWPIIKMPIDESSLYKTEEVKV